MLHKCNIFSICSILTMYLLTDLGLYSIITITLIKHNMHNMYMNVTQTIYMYCNVCTMYVCIFTQFLIMLIGQLTH